VIQRTWGGKGRGLSHKGGGLNLTMETRVMKTLLATTVIAVVVSMGSPASAQMGVDWTSWNNQWDSRAPGANQSDSRALGADAQQRPLTAQPRRLGAHAQQPPLTAQPRPHAAYAQHRPTTVQPRRNLAQPQVGDGHVHSPNPAFDVYDTENHYISSDPDPFIRNELARVPPERGDD
jgi:hypothetical protein